MNYHVGRSWAGHVLEDECICPQEACGLIDMSKAKGQCSQHGLKSSRSMRQIHEADRCPASPKMSPTGRTE